MLAGATALGVKYIPKVFAHKGIQKVVKDVNDIAEKGGFKAVMKEGAKDAAAGVGEGIKENLADPIGKAIKRNIKPVGLRFWALVLDLSLFRYWSKNSSITITKDM